MTTHHLGPILDRDMRGFIEERNAMIEELDVEKRQYVRDSAGRFAEVGGAGLGPGGRRISPHNAQPFETKSGRGGAPDNPNATRSSGTPQKYLDAQVARLKKETGLTPADLERNLSEVMTRTMTEHPELVDVGMNWYQDAHNRANEHARESGFTQMQAQGMTAAMSPNSEWGQNIAMTGEMMRQLRADEPTTAGADDLAWLKEKGAQANPRYVRDSHRAANSLLAKLEAGETPRLSDLPAREAAWAFQLVARRRQLIAENPTPKGTYPLVSFATGNGNMAKAIEIARGAHPDSVLGGHKVRSFFNNLSDPTNSRGFGDVTIDTHAASAAQLFRMPITSARADKTFYAGNSTASNQTGLYPIYADAFRAVAAAHNMSPNQAQAVLWIGWQSIRHDYPGVIVSEDAKTVSAGLTQQDVYGPARASTVGRYSTQTGASGEQRAGREGVARYRSELVH